MPLPDRTLRASDDDREQVVSRLGDHLAAGRLQTAEFEERMTAAYDATTLGELDVLTTDLPAERERPEAAASVALDKPADAGPAPVEVAPRRRFPRYGSWLSVSAVTTAVWGMSSVAAGDPQNFWPMWVIGPWGLAILFGMGGGHRFGHRGRNDD